MHDNLDDCLQFMFILVVYTHVVQKLNQLQTLADAALQPQTDQDMEHKYDNKDKVRWCLLD
jgi:hypothetical protein